MNRRRFLQLTGGGLIASATMAEAGFFAEFMDWLRRKPAWSIPAKRPINAVIGQYADFVSYSDLALASAPIVEEAAQEIARRAAFVVRNMYFFGAA